MPNRDGTGPNGQGSCTGKKKGLCNKNNITENLGGKENNNLENNSNGKCCSNGHGNGNGFGKRRCCSK